MSENLTEFIHCGERHKPVEITPPGALSPASWSYTLIFGEPDGTPQTSLNGSQPAMTAPVHGNQGPTERNQTLRHASSTAMSENLTEFSHFGEICMLRR